MPTELQKRGIKELSENPRNKGKALRKAGYSKTSSEKPKEILESKGWQELMEEYLPDNLLAEKHKELLNKKEVILRNNNKTKEIEVVPTGEIDQQAVGKALDLAYKLKGKYAAKKIKFEDDNEELTDEEVEDELVRVRKEREEFTKKPNVKKKTKSA